MQLRNRKDSTMRKRDLLGKGFWRIAHMTNGVTFGFAGCSRDWVNPETPPEQLMSEYWEAYPNDNAMPVAVEWYEYKKLGRKIERVCTKAFDPDTFAPLETFQHQAEVAQ
jgi:hypothetical protein